MSKEVFVKVQKDPRARHTLREFTKVVAAMFENTEVERVDVEFRFLDGSGFRTNVSRATIASSS